MKQVHPALAALLASNQFDMADLFTLTTVTGETVRYTDYDTDISVARFSVSGSTWTQTGQDIYSSTGPLLSRGKTKLSVGVEVDELDVTIAANSTHLLMGRPIIQVAHNGGLDGARIKLERAIMPTLGNASAGAVWMFEGRVSEIEVMRNTANLKVKSDLELLNLKMPRNVYQAGCLNSWGDTGCGIDKAAWAVSGVVQSALLGSIQTNLTQADGYFELGKIVFNSGANAGVVRTVKVHQSGQITFAYPLRTPAAVGDTFTIYPGCNGTKATCTNKFSNLSRFRGLPYIPVAETAV